MYKLPFCCTKLVDSILHFSIAKTAKLLRMIFKKVSLVGNSCQRSPSSCAAPTEGRCFNRGCRSDTSSSKFPGWSCLCAQSSPPAPPPRSRRSLRPSRIPPSCLRPTAKSSPFPRPPFPPPPPRGPGRLQVPGLCLGRSPGPTEPAGWRGGRRTRWRWTAALPFLGALSQRDAAGGEDTSDFPHMVLMGIHSCSMWGNIYLGCRRTPAESCSPSPPSIQACLTLWWKAAPHLPEKLLGRLQLW